MHQVGGAGDIEDIPLTLFHLLQGERRLAAARRANNNQRGLEGIDSVLSLVEGDDLIQHVECRMIRIDIDQRLRRHLFQRVQKADFALIHHRATIEKTGLS